MPEYHDNFNNRSRSSVLITGGTGLVGTYLTSLLVARGYNVSWLSRESGFSGKVRIFTWDTVHGSLAPGTFEGVDYLVHLAGANLGGKLWTAARKKEIRRSRIDSANLLFDTASRNDIKLKAFISASGIGYYGAVTSDRIYSEEDDPAEDFVATTCRLWEESADLFGGTGIRTVKLRTAVVVAEKSIAINRLMYPVKWGVAIRLGSGRQYFPWIHIEDLCNIYLKAIEDPRMSGTYNAVAPEYISHDDLIITMAGVLKRKVILPHVPAWVIRAALGEMAGLILEGSRISAEKIISAGYNFRFSKIEDALRDITGR